MRKLILFIFALFLVVLPASAVEYSGLFYLPTEACTFDDGSYLVLDKTDDSIYYFYPDGSGSASLIIYNGSSIVDIGLTTDHKLIIAHWSGSGDGFIYRLDHLPTSPVDYQDLDLMTLGVIPGGINSMIIDGSNNVYIANSATSASAAVYKLVSPSYIQSTLITSAGLPVALGSNEEFWSLANHPNGLLVATSGYKSSNGVVDLTFNLYSGSSVTSLYTYSYSTSYTGGTYVFPHGVYSVSNNDIYFSTQIQKNTNSYNLNRLNSSNSYTVESISVLTGKSTDLVIDNEGIIYSFNPDLHTISTHGTIGLVGGYSPIGIGGSSSSSSNPYLDFDGDGEFTQDDAKEMSLSLGPLMWVFFLMIFIMAAMGSRR